MRSPSSYVGLLVAVVALFATIVATAKPADASVVQPGDVLDSAIDCATEEPVGQLVLVLPEDTLTVQVGDDGGDAAGAGADAVRWTQADDSKLYVSFINCTQVFIWTGMGSETVTVSAFDPATSVTFLRVITYSDVGQDLAADHVIVQADAAAITVVVWLGPGNDILEVAPEFAGVIDAEGGGGSDILQGGAGEDFLWGASIDDAGAPTDRDRLFGRGGEDTLTGSFGNDFVKGGGGTDWLEGTLGDDTLIGGGGNDQMFGGPGDDVMRGQGGPDNMIGLDGDDEMDGGGGADVMSGGAGNDMIRGQTGPDLLSGNGDGGSPATDDDVLMGGAGNDILRGDEQNDVCAGNTGPADEAEAATCEIIRGVEVLF